MTTPPNLRHKNPRSLQARRAPRTELSHVYRWGLGASHAPSTPAAPGTAPGSVGPADHARLRHTYRFGLSGTPTPPPVTSTVVDHAEPSPPSRRAASPRPLTPARRALLGAATAAALLTLPLAWRWRGGVSLIEPDWRTPAALGGAIMQAATAAPVTPPSDTPAPATAGRHPIEGGVLDLPEGLSSQGSYDLLLHVHGEPDVVIESARAAGLQVPVVVLDLGPEPEAYAAALPDAGSFSRLIDAVETALATAGVDEPVLSRLAVSSWGPGSLAVANLLSHQKPNGSGPLDAVLLLDGAHCTYRRSSGNIDPDCLEPFIRTARAAASEQMLFGITHSERRPAGQPSYEGTAHALLRSIGAKVSLRAGLASPPTLPIAAAGNRKAARLKLAKIADTSVGSLRVQGFAGETTAHHDALLLQMAGTALGPLVKRWNKPATR